MSRKLRHRSHHGHSDSDHELAHEQTQDQELELLAYKLWEERGSPLGTPDEDWFKAEAHLERDEEAASKL